MSDKFVLREGHYVPSLYYQRYDYLQWFPARFWDWVPADEVEEENLQPLQVSHSKRCARCQRDIKPQYTYCYRCNNYLKVKARIAREMSA